MDSGELVINALPEEILEKIFSFTSQYRDYDNICLVNKKWNRIIDGLRTLNKSTFEDSFQNGQFYFRCFDKVSSPSHRHSHSSAVLDQTMYIFGGLSGTSTSYNDLWALDLNTKIWSRPLTSGNYPSPKAAATMTVHQNSLILYGGYSHPYSYPFNQQ
ncbi:F-box only 42, partial [Brachionus plicatilis]